MSDTSRLVVKDRDRILRNQLDKLAELRVYGTNASDVVRVLAAQAYAKHFGATAEEGEGNKDE